MTPSPHLLRFLLSLAAVGLAAACTSVSQPRLPAVAIAVRPVGDRPPSSDEIRQVLEALQPALLRAGASVAARRDEADFVMTVTFTPASDASGSRVTVVGIEPTARFREATDAGETAETKEFRRRMREIEGWDRSQAGGRDS